MGKTAKSKTKPASDISVKVVKPASQKKAQDPRTALWCVQAPKVVEQFFPDFAVEKEDTDKAIKFPTTKIYIIEKELNPEVVEDLKKQVVTESDENKGPLSYLEIRRQQVAHASNPWSFQSKPSRESMSKRARKSDDAESSLFGPSQNPVVSLLSAPRGLLRKRR